MKIKKIAKKCAVVVMAASLLVGTGNGFVPNNNVCVEAATTYTSGFWSYVKYSDGTVGVSSYSGLDEEVTIPDTIEGMKVTQIEQQAFYNNKNVYKVNIPNTVTTIGHFAFAGSNITSITIPDTVTTWKTNKYTYYPDGTYIGSTSLNGAFAQCENLETVIFKSETIPNYAFISCPNLKYVTLGEKTKYIHDYAFWNDKNIVKFDVNSNLQTIGSYSFWKCENLKTISLGNELTSIGLCTFAGSGLTSITIPDTVKTWSAAKYVYFPNDEYTGSTSVNAAFAQCKNLETVVIGSEEVPSHIFYACSNIKNVTLGEKTKYIRLKAFKDNVSMENIVVNSNLYGLESECFRNCTNLKSIFLGNELKSIGMFVFASSGLESITLPDTIKTWSTEKYVYYPNGDYSGSTYVNGAFAECNNLEKVNVGHLEMPANVFNYSEKVNIHCMEGTSAYNYAIDNGFSYTLYDEIPATSVKLASDSYTMINGTTLKLYPIMEPENSTDNVSWTIGNTNIVTIDECNVVTAKSTGLVAVKCKTKSGKSYSFTITVVDSGDATVENVYVKNIGLSSVEGITDMEYTGEPTTQNIKVMFNNCTELNQGTDYTVSYKNNTKIGTATVIITGKGAYKGTINKTYKIIGDEVIYEWKEYENGWKYEGSDGSYSANEWKCINGRWYHFDANGYMQTGWYKEGSKYYYLKSNGVMASAEFVEDGKYYINSNGVWETSTKWLKIDNKYYYIKSGEVQKSKWLKVGVKYYYFDATGVMQSNKWIQNKYYVKSDGSMAVSEFIGNYYVDENGIWVTGTKWINVNNKYYYIKSGIVQKSKWLKVGTKYYYFDAAGVMQANKWIQNKYYVKSDGSMAVSEFVENGKYYVDENGIWVTGSKWLKVNNNWYYILNGIVQQSKWTKIGTKYYYFDATGVMQTSKWINGTYYVKADGSMAVSEWVDNGKYYVGSDGKWVEGA